MIANDSHIYCGNCGKVQPLARDYMPADDRNDHSATDLLCVVCSLVIATIHHLEPTIEQINAARSGTRD